MVEVDRSCIIIISSISSQPSSEVMDWDYSTPLGKPWYSIFFLWHALVARGLDLYFCFYHAPIAMAIYADCFSIWTKWATEHLCQLNNKLTKVEEEETRLEVAHYTVTVVARRERKRKRETFLWVWRLMNVYDWLGKWERNHVEVGGN